MIAQEELNSFLAVAEDLQIRGLSGDETGKSLNEKWQSPQKDIFGEKKYELPPKKQFSQKFADMEFNESIGTELKNAKVEINDGHNKVTDNNPVNMESWD